MPFCEFANGNGRSNLRIERGGDAQICPCWRYEPLPTLGWRDRDRRIRLPAIETTPSKRRHTRMPYLQCKRNIRATDEAESPPFLLLLVPAALAIVERIGRIIRQHIALDRPFRLQLIEQPQHIRPPFQGAIFDKDHLRCPA